MKIDQLRSALQRRPDATILQHNQLVDKYAKTVVEFENVILEDISTEQIELRNVGNDTTYPTMRVQFRKQDIQDKGLNGFLRGDRVLVVARLINPHNLSFELISIVKDHVGIREESNRKQEREANIESAAKAAGIRGAIKTGIKYGLVGIIVAYTIGLLAGNIVAIIIFILSILFGGFIGYLEESQTTREQLRR